MRCEQAGPAPRIWSSAGLCIPSLWPGRARLEVIHQHLVPLHARVFELGWACMISRSDKRMVDAGYIQQFLEVSTSQPLRLFVTGTSSTSHTSISLLKHRGATPTHQCVRCFALTCVQLPGKGICFLHYIPIKLPEQLRTVCQKRLPTVPHTTKEPLTCKNPHPIIPHLRTCTRPPAST